MVHGACNSAAVWTHWQTALAEKGWPTHAVDLRGHGRSPAMPLGRTSMWDYAQDVAGFARELRQSPVLMGWSMGGLVAMMAARNAGARAVVALAPSMPAYRPGASVVLRTGEYGPEEYGILDRHAKDQPEMPDLDDAERTIALASLGQESMLARDERKSGIVIDALPCPLLLVTGGADVRWPAWRYRDLWLEGEHLSLEGVTHWGLALSRPAIGKAIGPVTHWLGQLVGEGAALKSA
jgi:pimeloyl-ACP methyl ester carboxylesterase